jgi:serine/threonine protein kinase
MTTATRFDSRAAASGYRETPTLPRRYAELPEGTPLGRFRVGPEIGRGSFAVVYRATDPWLGREVALKVLARHGQDDRPAAGREAGLLSRVHSPHVVTVFDLVRDGEWEAVVLELVTGPTVDVICRDGPLPPSDVGRIGEQLAEGLDVLHGAGIVHGDIKPTNLRLSASGVLKILDLGVSRDMAADAESPCRVVAGTPAYMAPERLRGACGDARSDIWSAGAVLFELATGRCAVDDLSDSSRSAFIREGIFPDPQRLTRGIARPLRDVVAAAMAPEPGRRLQNARELRRALTDGVPAPTRAVRPAGMRYLQRLVDGLRVPHTA